MPFDDANKMLMDLMTAVQPGGEKAEKEKWLIYKAVCNFGTSAFSNDLAKPME